MIDAELFSSFVDILINLDDHDGSYITLGYQMLSEIPESRFKKAKNFTFELIKKKLINGFNSKVRSVDVLAKALMHPSSSLRQLALTDVSKFANPSTVAFHLLFGGDAYELFLKNKTKKFPIILKNEPWYKRRAGCHSIGLLSFNDGAGEDKVGGGEIRDMIIHGLVELWGDVEPTVRHCAVEAVKDLSLQDNLCVIREILRQLVDKDENFNGHELLFALETSHKSIISLLLLHSISENNPESSYAFNSLKILSTMSEVRYFLSNCISGHESLSDLLNNVNEMIDFDFKDKAFNPNLIRKNASNLLLICKPSNSSEVSPTHSISSPITRRKSSTSTMSSGRNLSTAR